jgi:hypothetical protein
MNTNTDLEELRSELFHMDLSELIAFGRQHRAIHFHLCCHNNFQIVTNSCTIRGVGKSADTSCAKLVR